MRKVLTIFQLKISNQKKLKIFLIFIIIYCFKFKKYLINDFIAKILIQIQIIRNLLSMSVENAHSC